METTFRELRNVDESARAALFALSFPETAGTPVATPSHYQWKFRAFPASPASYEYVVATENRLSAYYAALPYPYRTPAGPCTAGMVCDVMTHPDDRGKGLFTHIGRYATDGLAEQGLAFTTGYPIRPEVLPGHLKVGWKVVEKMPVWLRPVASRSLLPGFLKALAPLVDPVMRVAMLWTRPGSGYQVDILDRHAFLVRMAQDGRIDALIERWQSAVPVALRKDRQFLEWRTAAPGAEYRFALLSVGDSVLGLSVLRPTTLKGIACLAMLDFMMDPDRCDGALALHHGVAMHARSSGLDAVACMSSRQWASRYRFMRSGYVRTPATFSLIVKKLDQDLPDDMLFDPTSWHPFWLDSDDL